jgi:hypothetical protein
LKKIGRFTAAHPPEQPEKPRLSTELMTRGTYFRHEQDMICSFVICIAGLVAYVRIRQVMGKTVTILTWNTADSEDGSTLVHTAKF